MAVVTVRQLLDAGVHFGHQTRRWNPKMKRFIFTDRSGIYIIDLQKSVKYIDEAYEFVKNTVARGGQILFVGTKKQAQQTIVEQATRVNQPYVSYRWLGGLLTNFKTVTSRLQRMQELEELDYEGGTSGLTKKELLLKRRELEKLKRSLGGIRNLTRTPSALWVVDTNKEHLAIVEAKKLGIPVIAVLDTNCDPDDVTYPVPGNDDSIRSVGLLTKIIADAAAQGMIERHQAPAENEESEVVPLAEWEMELLQAGTVTKPEAEEKEADAKAEKKAETKVEKKADAKAEKKEEAPAEEAAVEKAPAKKTGTKSAAKKTAAKAEKNEDASVKESSEKESAKKDSSEKDSAEKDSAKKDSVKKAPAKKAPAKKTAAKKSEAKAEEKTEEKAEEKAEAAEKKPAAKKTTAKKTTSKAAEKAAEAEDKK